MRTIFEKLLMWNLRIFARFTLRKYEPGVIAVTGSVGKTSTKEAIRAVVARAHHVRVAAKSFNNEIGVPLTILGDWEESGGTLFWLRVFCTALLNLLVRRSSYPEALVLEYAIDRPGDMDRLIRIAPPDVAVMTAMGDVPVHVEFFSGPEAVLHEKAKLVRALKADGFAILNADDPKVAGVGDLTRGHVVTYGFEEGADVRLVNFKNHLEGSEASVHFKLAHNSTVVPVSIPEALGRAEVYAAGAAAAVGLVFGMNLVAIAGALETYVPPPGRFRALKGVKNTLLIDSTYNASPLSMEEALDTLKTLPAPRKISVLGDMLELGKFTLSTHEELGVHAAKTCDVLITVGHRAKFIAEGALAHGMPKGKVHPFLTLADTAGYLKGAMKPGDLILFKASQGVRLERVLKLFLKDPAKAEAFLVRQDAKWLREKGLYDEGELE